ncbi:MAG: proteasome assembly chaperone family protein [Candidatus Nezhaarchaeales archaeon]
MVGEVRLIEKPDVKLESPIVVEGFPDVGLVGAIAASYLVSQLKLQELGYMESELFPPIMVLHRGTPQDPVRLYGNSKLVTIISEIAIPPEAIHPLAKSLAEWLKKVKANVVISLNGFPVQHRMEIETPSVFGVATESKLLELLKQKGIEPMEEGFIAGVYAVILKECIRRNIPMIALLAECFPAYPDPGAAASVLQALNNLFNLNVDVKPLLDKAEEIRLKTRDLMKQTQRLLPGLQKAREQEVPLMYT